MEFSRFSNEKISRFRKKLIPWHYQKRYQESLSEFSMNHSFLTALYKKKIKSLQKNNKFLALALQHHRSVITEKENVMIENGKGRDIINFSRLKLMDMVEQMKKSTACLEETLQLLNLGISDNLSKHAENVNYRTDFKNKLHEINIEPIEEVIDEENISENINSSEEHETYLNESNPSKNACSVKRKGKHVANISKVFYSRNSNSPLIISPTYRNLRNSKKNGCVVQCKKKRMSLENNTSKGSICTSKPSPEISNALYNTNYFLNKSDKNEACVVLSEINQKKMDHTVKNIMNFEKASEREIYSKKKTISKKINEVESIFLSASNSSCDKLQNSINESQTCTTNTNLKPCITLNGQLRPNAVILTAENKPEISVQNNDVELVCDKINDRVDVNKVEKNITNSENECKEASAEIKNNTEVHNSKCRKRVCFYFDEEAIETMKSKKTASKVKNSFAKRRALRTITEKTECNNKINIQHSSFVVTAEIHPTPDDVCKDKTNNEKNILSLQPSVVLTDILKSNKALTSDTINESLENDCLRKVTCVKSTEAEMDVKENDPNAIYLNSEMEKEKLPMESLLEKKDYRRRTKIVNYKEPLLNTKVRRFI